MSKGEKRMSWDIEYSIEIDFRNQGLASGRITPYYNGVPKDIVQIDEDGTAMINIIKDKKEAQKLKIVMDQGQAIIDLNMDESKPQFSGGGNLVVEVRSLEIPKQVIIGEDGEEKSMVVDENGVVRDSNCCCLI